MMVMMTVVMGEGCGRSPYHYNHEMTMMILEVIYHLHSHHYHVVIVSIQIGSIFPSSVHNFHSFSFLVLTFAKATIWSSVVSLVMKLSRSVMMSKQIEQVRSFLIIKL